MTLGCEFLVVAGLASGLFSAPAVFLAASSAWLSPPNSLVKKSNGLDGAGVVACETAGLAVGVAVGAGFVAGAGAAVGVAVTGAIGLVSGIRHKKAPSV